MSRAGLTAVRRTIGMAVGLPFASWRRLARGVEVRRQDAACPWPLAGFPDDGCEHPGDIGSLQRAGAGFGPAFHRVYSARVSEPVLDAGELMAIVRGDPNVACPKEVAGFERGRDGGEPLEAGEELRVRLPGPWNGPVRVVAVGERSFRLATLQGHMEAGEIEFSADDDAGGITLRIESWARSGDRVFAVLYDRLSLARELQLDLWVFFLERMAQVAGGRIAGGIDVRTERCAEHPL